MQNFIYDIDTKVYFGEGQLENLGAEILKYTDRILLCHNGGSVKRNGVYDKVVAELNKNKIFFKELDKIEPNPSIDEVKVGIDICRENDLKGVLAVGGGSVIDCAKVIAGGVNLEFNDPWEIMQTYLKDYEMLPVFTVLTLAATGSEMNGVSVITNKKLKIKGSTFTRRPVVSILDPTFTYSVPEYYTEAGVVDIISHTLETYFSKVTDFYLLNEFAISIVKTCIKYGPVLKKDPKNYEARANIMWAATYAINGVIAHGRPHAWTLHPMSHPITAYYGLTHGATFSILLPNWMEYILDERTVKLFVPLGVEVFGIDKTLSEMEIAKETIKRFREFFKSIGQPLTFTEAGIDDRYFKEIVDNMIIRGNERRFAPFTKEDVMNIYKKCL